ECYQEAAVSYRQASPASRELTTTLNNFGDMLVLEGKTVDAERIYREALPIARQALGPRDQSTLLVAGKLARVLRQINRPDGAAVGVPVARAGNGVRQLPRAALQEQRVAGVGIIARVVERDGVLSGGGHLNRPDGLVVFAGPESEVAVLLFPHERLSVDFAVG